MASRPSALPRSPGCRRLLGQNALGLASGDTRPPASLRPAGTCVYSARTLILAREQFAPRLTASDGPPLVYTHPFRCPCPAPSWSGAELILETRGELRELGGQIHNSPHPGYKLGCPGLGTYVQGGCLTQASPRLGQGKKTLPLPRAAPTLQAGRLRHLPLKQHGVWSPGARTPP